MVSEKTSSVFAPYSCQLPLTEWQVGEALIGSISDRLSITDLDENWFKVGELANIFAQQIQGSYPSNTGVEIPASVVVNELLENVVKFGAPGSFADLEFFFFSTYYEILLTNACSIEQGENFKFYLERLSGSLQTKSLNRLFEEKITLSSLGSSTKTELGLLMILKDYGSKIKVEMTQTDKSVLAKTKIQLKVG